MGAKEFVQSYFDAWNHSDAEGVADHLTKDGTYIDVTSNEQHSRESLVANLTEFFNNEHHSYQLAGDILSNGNSIAFQYRMTSEDPAEADWHGAEFIKMEQAGAIVISDYYDTSQPAGPQISPAETLATKYAKSGLSPDQLEVYTRQLKSLMEGERVFLQSDLTMPNLAELVDCSVNHLSQAINSGFGMSFFDFLNSYRIDEAKSLLQKSDPDTMAILDVSLAAGFNSNSAFYASFKKVTGQTPAQFRRAFVLGNIS